MRRLFIIALALLAGFTASPVPGLSQAADPCQAALGQNPATAMRVRPDRPQKYGPLGNDSRDPRDLLHQSAAAQGRVRSTAQAARPLADRDENNIAILEDNNGDLIIQPNLFDLSNTGLRFEPAGGSYIVTSIDAQFRASLGRGLNLSDDDSSTPFTPAFAFDFYGRRVSAVFVNSDGNVTFEAGDNESTERGITRLSTGQPRIAPFFADLDPSVSGGVFVSNTAEAMSFTWCAVPAFGMPQTMTVQATMFPTGAIEFRFGGSSLTDGIVALSPGNTEQFTNLDLRAAADPPAAPVAFGERFVSSSSLDLVAAARRFYATHRDDYDQLVFWTDSPVMNDAFAFETTVKNSITGLGLDILDLSSRFGSAGALESIVNMDRVSKYPAGPAGRFFNDSSTLGILAHETGHRWLTRLAFIDHNREMSEALLGRQRAHWSFFMDSDGSVMEGNEIEDQGGGTFRTRLAPERYSRLDLYAMGLADASEVPRWFYVDAPIAAYDREDGTISNVTFNGTRRDVAIQDVIDAMGPRLPSAASSRRLHRQAFIYVRTATPLQEQQDLNKLSRIREQFGDFFSRATEDRMQVRTTLTP
ncbi:MAG TPA: hypothetical protein VF239_20060 [Vicinamibacterales bacterium]